MSLFDGLLKLLGGLGKRAIPAPSRDHLGTTPAVDPVVLMSPLPVELPADRPLPTIAKPPLVTASQLIAMGATRANAEKFASPLCFACERFGITTPARLRMFIAQTMAETLGFALLKENLGYSVKNLMDVWPKDFPTVESTAGFAGNPQALAERKYGGRNGNTAPGDGFKYRGRGLLQLTFKSNYQGCAAATGLDCVNRPELLETPDGAAVSAAWFFKSRGCNEMSDANTEAAVEAVSRRINGGTNGMKERKSNWARGKSVF